MSKSQRQEVFLVDPLLDCSIVGNWYPMTSVILNYQECWYTCCSDMTVLLYLCYHIHSTRVEYLSYNMNI